MQIRILDTAKCAYYNGHGLDTKEHLMPRLYTLGYEGLSLDQFIAKLKGNNVEAVVDVRELPLSRKRGFSKTRLAEALYDAGIGYQSIRALGSPRELRRQLRQTRDWGTFSIQFEQHLNSQSDVLGELVECAYRKPTRLMCFEYDSSLCHRSIVAKRAVSLANNGITVKHL